MIDFANLEDEFGGIDKNLLALIIALNEAGFRTTGCCEGHASKQGSTPAPYVLIDGRMSAGNSSRVAHMKALLNDFYAESSTPHDVRIVVRRAVNGLYYIHNGGAAFGRWRRSVARRVEAKKQKRSTLHFGLIHGGEEKQRKKTLPLFQKEMKTFAKFLKQNFRE